MNSHSSNNSGNFSSSATIIATVVRKSASACAFSNLLFRKPSQANILPSALNIPLDCGRLARSETRLCEPSGIHCDSCC
ncbi:unnamed protein product [Tuber melanosporum]|uniref:(Perigord truffle) hypothetical protein n=1 Tax=Tuber melanosporum (strain Mel28) TaxID=656061 RepID=D5G8H7_TUBMM|nr:uncharacterized protein GSTUM_00002878001 [Tuber melanosporum]CAZ80824.1 unnamed protein product [Tuber melanosporum]